MVAQQSQRIRSGPSKAGKLQFNSTIWRQVNDDPRITSPGQPVCWNLRRPRRLIALVCFAFHSSFNWTRTVCCRRFRLPRLLSGDGKRSCTINLGARCKLSGPPIKLQPISSWQRRARSANWGQLIVPSEWVSRFAVLQRATLELPVLHLCSFGLVIGIAIAISHRTQTYTELAEQIEPELANSHTFGLVNENSRDARMFLVCCIGAPSAQTEDFRHSKQLPPSDAN